MHKTVIKVIGIQIIKDNDEKNKRDIVKQMIECMFVCYKERCFIIQVNSSTEFE